MLHILLLIIKIIGIAFAVLMGLTLLILIVPVSYKGKGDSKNPTKFFFKAGGLLRLVYFKFIWKDEEMKYILRVFGIPVIRGMLGEQNEKIADEELGGLFSNFEDKIVVKLSKEERDAAFLKKEKDKQAGLKESADDEYIKEVDDPPVKNDSKEKEKKSGTNRSGLLDFIKKIVGRIKTIPKSIKAVRRKIRKLKRFLKSKRTKIAFYYSKETIRKLYHHMKPAKLKANITFGFESPDMTGKALAVLSVVYGTMKVEPETFSVTPDFQKKRFEGELYLKGNFVLAYVLVQMIRWYFKKEVHDIIESFHS